MICWRSACAQYWTQSTKIFFISIAVEFFSSIYRRLITKSPPKPYIISGYRYGLADRKKLSYVSLLTELWFISNFLRQFGKCVRSLFSNDKKSEQKEVPAKRQGSPQYYTESTTILKQEIFKRKRNLKCTHWALSRTEWVEWKTK